MRVIFTFGSAVRDAFHNGNTIDTLEDENCVSAREMEYPPVRL